MGCLDLVPSVFSGYERSRSALAHHRYLGHRLPAYRRLTGSTGLLPRSGKLWAGFCRLTIRNFIARAAHETDVNHLRTRLRLFDRQLCYVFQTRDQTLHTKLQCHRVALLGESDCRSYELLAMVEQQFFVRQTFLIRASRRTPFAKGIAPLKRSTSLTHCVHSLTLIF